MSKISGAEIRQSFIDFFVEKGHTFVPSSPLVPGGDATLLFTNAGMVQFKDVFLGTDMRDYKRAVNSQKCMRVAGKHNDLEDVGRDNTHHTFFEMLGNWSFGDYYKKEAITWAWELLTNVWGVNKSLLWATVFKDDKGNIPTDEEAYESWNNQPGFLPGHVVFSSRKDNFWEMAETGPCGPCSEIHYDFGPEGCNKKGAPGHVCQVNGDCTRYLEIWNLVFIQYNRLGPTDLVPLPATHVDTGMGLDRIVSILQRVSSNYRTDLLFPLMDKIQELTGHTSSQQTEFLTAYRVITDHVRASTFLIADGVVPGNIGRNYICRMIIRRCSRFGRKIGLLEPFMAFIAEVVIKNYGPAYPELAKNRTAILDNLTREENRFQRTVVAGITHLNGLLEELKSSGNPVLDGKQAFNLYATLGLPFEITRDEARDQGLDVDESGFRQAMEEHRLASGGGKAMGTIGGQDADLFREILLTLVEQGKIDPQGVVYDPYKYTSIGGEVLALVKDGVSVTDAEEGDPVEVLLPKTCFYVESGGQVSDQGVIKGRNWEIQVQDVRKPAAGVIVHIGKVTKGFPQVDDEVQAMVDLERRRDIMRNHTATHLLHAQLHFVLGEHARQAGSLVAPDHLRFDFTHPEAVRPEQIELIEAGVNRAILENHHLNINVKPLQQAILEGAMALFGEKYSETVRTISIGDQQRFSYELCGGTHVEETGDIGLFVITSEGSAAAGVRRIEAVTGRKAYELVQRRIRALKQTAALLSSSLDEVPEKAQSVLEELEKERKGAMKARQDLAVVDFSRHLEKPTLIGSHAVLSLVVPSSDADTLRQLADRFRQKYASGVVVLGSAMEGRPVLIAAVTDDLVKLGINAGDLVKTISAVIGGSGGGRPNLAQAGGKDAEKLQDAINLVLPYLQEKIR